MDVTPIHKRSMSARALFIIGIVSLALSILTGGAIAAILPIICFPMALVAHFREVKGKRPLKKEWFSIISSIAAFLFSAFAISHLIAFLLPAGVEEPMWLLISWIILTIASPIVVYKLLTR